ncbi:hypothetical protein GJ688_05170 [Heliobacillus mobilis]|uniref:PD-(D/E)XK endonuclease-like domain-containing protein n=1 Tax=Heliobacterium mobile TaxID=28064 RepID=A0A6I3SHX4_HELMO|nr:PD-(D/E)XK nuclease family protein [Heliobacterium mobile]MTV48372.1 hypothetical protein [Heliobacterium mobile]
MNIILGYWLDSVTYPDALGEKEASAGTVVTGFHGLIGILETQLGLTSPETSQNLRIADWQELIRHHDSGNMPYSKSFGIDSWNTAKELLRRRDELVLAGWDPEVYVGGSLWIDTLAQLERSNPKGKRGFPDRVRALLAELQKRVPLHIDRIAIVDEDETLWDPWAVHLIDAIKRLGVPVVKESVRLGKDEQQKPMSDLSLLQKIMSGELSTGQACGDGSLLLIRSEQEWDAADFLISWLWENGSEDTVLIKGEGSLFLDEFFHRRGLPALGVDVSSKWRAVLQVLPLTIDTYWKPLRIERMMELLTIPTSPVPWRIRYRLAKVLADAPGIGGPQWLQAIEEGKQAYEEQWASEGLDESTIRKRRKDLNDQLDLWVNHDYYDSNDGIPFEKLISICQKVSRWAANELRIADDPLYGYVMKYVQEVIEGVTTLGESTVSRLQVGRILESVIGEGAELSNYIQEASKWQVVQHPGQIWGKADTILWWGFHRTMSGPSVRTWTSKERSWLRQHGLFLSDEHVQRKREAASWQQAARFANRRLILFAPVKVKGKEMPTHPFWDEIRHALARENHLVSSITVNASELRKKPSFSLHQKVFERVSLEPRNIPAPMRKWEIPANMIGPRAVESATSFESLVACPLTWVLRYAANVKPASALSLPNESRMLGNLGHKILETLIEEKRCGKAIEIEGRTGELFDEWSPLLAAPLLELQNGIKRNEIRLKLQKSLKQFFILLHHVGIQIQHTELSLQRTWSEGVELEGTLDLVGETAAGKKILIDAKWSSRPRRYKAKLEKISVQLALYHWLLSDHEMEELPVAYFMLSSGEFFALPHGDIPSVHHVVGPSPLEQMNRLRASLDDVWTYLFHGIVMAPGIPMHVEDADPFTPLIEPLCTFCDYQHLCGAGRVSQ